MLDVLHQLRILASRDQAKCEVAAADTNQQVNNNSNRDTNGGAPKIRPSRAYADASTSLHKEQQIITLVEHVVTTFDALDLLVNNAGGQFALSEVDASRVAKPTGNTCGCAIVNINIGEPE